MGTAGLLSIEVLRGSRGGHASELSSAGLVKGGGRAGGVLLGFARVGGPRGVVGLAGDVSSCAEDSLPSMDTVRGVDRVPVVLAVVVSGASSEVPLPHSVVTTSSES